MVELKNDAQLSILLKAVSDSTRRTLLTQLCQLGAMRVSDLAATHKMSLNAVSKHIKVLEQAKLVQRKTQGRTHWIEAELDQINLITNWLEQLKSIWSLRLDKLEVILTEPDKQDD